MAEEAGDGGGVSGDCLSCWAHRCHSPLGVGSMPCLGVDVDIHMQSMA